MNSNLTKEQEESILCSCGNPEMGFDCVCEHIRMHPGTKQFSCEFCGYYVAGSPRCSKCEEG